MVLCRTGDWFLGGRRRAAKRFLWHENPWRIDSAQDQWLLTELVCSNRLYRARVILRWSSSSLRHCTFIFHTYNCKMPSLRHFSHYTRAGSQVNDSLASFVFLPSCDFNAFRLDEHQDYTPNWTDIHSAIFFERICRRCDLRPYPLASLLAVKNK